MKKQRITALLLAALCTAGSVPLTASAASAQVLEIDGERVALFSAFGKMNYNGKAHATYKSFNEALEALGNNGGKLVFAGNAEATDFRDVAGRGTLTIEGVGTKSSSNTLYFPGEEVNLYGDTVFDFINLRLDENAYLYTNGHSFETINEFDTYHYEQYIAGASNQIVYPNPPSIALGKVDADKDGVINLSSGTYTTLAAGSVNGKAVEKDTYVTLTGGTVENVVAGNIGNGTMNGNAKLVIGEGTIQNLTAGSLGGTVNGNVTTVINGGNIANATIGAAAGATINGSVIVALNGGTFGGKITLGSGNVTGKKIVITGTETVAYIADGAADYIIKTDGAFCEPQFDGATLRGFKLSDKYGIPAKVAVINGTEQKNENGIYEIPTGVSTVKVVTDVNVSVNKNATYVAGYSDGRFAPQNNLTRAEAITMLVRLVTDESIIKGYVTSDYIDVEEGAWYESYIGLFEKLGYLENIEGKGGAAIYPNQNITRGEFVELVYRVNQLGSAETPSVKLGALSDISGSDYVTAINFAVSTGIVAGYEDGTFRPNKEITRAEVVTIVNRFLGRTPNGAQGAISFSDIDSHWAKSQILAAAGNENETWTASDNTEAAYTMSGTSAADYIPALYDQSANLSADAIRGGVDAIAEQMKKDILETANTEDYYDLSDKTIYYVSEKNGNDDNDGKSPETAFKTLSAVTSKIKLVKLGKLVVLFERGGIYRGSFSPTNGAIYGSYGEGSKPLLMQSKRNYADPELWEETEVPNVWKCTEQLVNVGVIGYDHDLFDYSEDSYHELYGDIYNIDTFGFTGIEDMKKDLAFYSVVPGNGDLTTQAGDLYVYSTEGNPGSRFNSIEIGERINIVSGSPNGATFDNLAFKFTGGHAIGFGTCKDVTVTNCVFSWIGGSVLSGNGVGNPATNYGNAIEIYGGCDGYRVENNWMYQIYDTAVTHQRSATTGDCTQENIRYTSNLMEYVHWGIETYNAPPTKEILNGKKDTYTRYTKDYRARYNLLRFGGYGWGSLTRYRTNSARLFLRRRKQAASHAIQTQLRRPRIVGRNRSAERLEMYRTAGECRRDRL